MRGKHYQQIKSKIDSTKTYSLDEAIKFIKENPAANFDESIEVHLKLGIDPQKTEQHVRGVAVLPSGLAKKRRIIAFVSPAKVEEAKEAGADLVGGLDLIEKIKETEKCNFDLAVAEPELMKDLAKIAKILGPKGLMPNPKTKTVTNDIKSTLKELAGGRINFKNDEGGNLHQVLAKVSWPAEKIKENIKAFLEAVRKTKPAGVKGNFIRNTILSSTMGPGIRISF